MSKIQVAAGWLSASTLSDGVNRAEPAGNELLVGTKTPADTALRVVKKRLAIHPLVGASAASSTSRCSWPAAAAA